MMEDKGPLFHIYCDESRQVEDRFMIFGGIIVSFDDLAKTEQSISTKRNDTQLFGELKWTKISNERCDGYRDFVDLFFVKAKSGLIAFKSVVFDTSHIDYHTYHGGSKEIGFYKLWYQFLLYAFKDYCTSSQCRWKVFLDERSSSYSLSEFKTILNKGIRTKYNLSADIVRSVEPIKSHNAPILQIADILMGAIGFQMNDYHLRPQARIAKINIAHYISEKAGLLSLKQKTALRMKQFSIWHFPFYKAGEQGKWDLELDTHEEYE